MSDRPPDRLSITVILVLTTGAALGMSLLRIALITGSIPTSLGYLIYGFYVSISGMTIASLPLILRDRIAYRAIWGVGAHYLFVSGCSAAIFVPMIVTQWTLENPKFEPWHVYAKLIVAHNPGRYALESFYHMWVVTSFLFFLSAIVGGANRQWYMIRGYWADGIGIWCALAWALPLPFVVWGFISTYMR